jgi:hypothetical protein
VFGESRRVGVPRRVRTLRELLVIGLVVSGLAASSEVAFDQAVAAADPPAVACVAAGNTLMVQLSGQSTSADPLGIAASGGDYVIYLGTSANPQCAVGGPFALATEPDVQVTSSGMVSQYVALDNTNGQLASASAGCPVAFTVALDTPSSGTDTVALLDDSSSPATLDDDVAVSSSSSAGSTSESLNLSEGGCATADVSVSATTSPPNVDVTGQAGTGDELDLSATNSSSSSAIAVDVNGDSTGTPGAVTGEPGAISVGFSGIETVVGADFATSIQPGTASGVQFDGQPSVTNTLDLSGEGSPAHSLVVNVGSGTVTGVSSGGGSLSDGFAGVRDFVGSSVGTTFDATASGGLTFAGAGSGNSLDLSAAPPGAIIDAGAGTASELTGSITTDAFSGIASFTGSSQGSTTFVAAASGGLGFTGQGTGNALDLSGAPSGATVNAATGTASGLTAGIGSSTTDTFLGIASFTGSSSGSTTFTAAGSGGLSFTGHGTGNALDLSASPGGGTIDVATSAVTGLSSGIGSSTTDSFADIASFTGSSFGTTTFTATGSGGLTFHGKGTGDSLDLSAAPTGTHINAATGTASGLAAGIGASTNDAFSGIAAFIGSSSGDTTFTAASSGGVTFTGAGAGNTLDLSAAPTGANVDPVSGAVTGLSPGIGSSTTDTFSDVAAFTGSSSGSTTFTAASSGGLTFTGKGTGNALDLSAAPSGATVDARTGVATGLASGIGSSTTDSFTDIAAFTGSSSGSTTFTAASSGGLTFTGKGTGNALNLGAAPTGTTVDAAIGAVSGLSSGIGSSTSDTFTDIATFTGSSSGATSFDATGKGGFTYIGQGSGNGLDLSPAPGGATVNAATGIASGLTAGAGSSTTDSFADIADFTGSSSGATTFTAAGSGGLTFNGVGTGNALDLSAAPAGAGINALAGTVSGLTSGIGSSTTDSFTDVATFTGSSAGTTTLTSTGSGGLTFHGKGTANAIDLSAAPAGAGINAATGAVTGLTSGIGSSTTDSFTDVAAFTGSSAGTTTFTSTGSGGLTFHGKGTGDSLDLSAAPSGAIVDAATGVVSGLSSGVGSSTTDAFSGIASFTGSSSGATTFTAASTGGLTFTGKGTGNALGLSAAPPGATVDIGADSLASPGVVHGLATGILSSTTDAFSDVGTFTGSLAPSEPTNPTAAPLDGSASVAFVAPAAQFGTPVTGYTVTATDLTTPANGGEHATGTTSPVTITGLTNGDSYTFTVSATNTNGTGPSSLASSAVTPKKTQSVRFTTSTPNMTRVGGASYLPTATSTSGMTVTIALDVTSTGCVYTNSIVSFPAAGVCIIDASQAGGGIYAPAPTVRQRITVLRAINAITVTSTPPKRATVPDSYRPSAVSTSGDRVAVRVAAHLKACVLDKGVVRFVQAGLCVLVFHDAGNAGYLPAPERLQRFEVAKGSVAIRALAIPRAASSSRSITMRAILSSLLAHGSVRFSIGGVGLCAAAIHNRVATCRIARELGKGLYRVTASYLGSASYGIASTVTDLRIT